VAILRPNVVKKEVFMKQALLGVLILAMGSYSFGDAREIVLKVAKGTDGKTHWMPEKIEVTQGETVKFIARYDPPKGAYEFHGFSIPVLKIQEEVYLTDDKHKPVEVTKTIPMDLKPGEYKVTCHLHAAHLPAILVVKKK
jgi:plastocyanin